MSVFALHAGNLHLRSAFLGERNLPTTAEDSGETQRFLTPSIVTIDAGGSQFGYPALMCAEAGRAETALWRFKRRGLATREPVAIDRQGRGLTAEAFLAYALGKFDADARAWAPEPPNMAVVVPDETSATTRLRLATLAFETTGRTVAIVGESNAVLALLGSNGDGDFLVVSVDDDATRVRVLRADGGSATVQASEESADLGLEALRAEWAKRWEAESSAASMGTAFGAGDSFEFERIWQDIWDCLNDDPRDKPKMPTWPLLRRSTINALTVPRAALLAELGQRWRAVAELAEQVLAAASVAPANLAGLVVVADPALARIVANALGGRLAIPEGRRTLLPADAYARGGAALAASVSGKFELGESPHGIGVIGMAKDGSGTTVRALIEKGTALPASASFSIMANRDAQRMLALTLETMGAESALSHRFEFGPMSGVGMLRVNMHVLWERNNRILVTATDSESSMELKSGEAVEIVAGKALAGANHVKALLGI